ncbi:MAG: hypothetical protein JRI68_02905 [Deltaproteobacteria bacterium]|nr:hypothetical protein [Deltaproteobacteria bacterium]
MTKLARATFAVVLLALSAGCGTPVQVHTGGHRGERHVHSHCHQQDDAERCHSHRHGVGHHP